MTYAAVDRKKSRWKETWVYIREHPWLYLMLIPSFVYLAIFCYGPMYGIVIAFQDFNLVRGISGSNWIGVQNFVDLFSSRQFTRVFRNSVVFSLLRIAWGFPAPILLALLLNEVRSLKFKKAVQTIIYIPHFVSWVVVAGMVKNILGPDETSMFNKLMSYFGLGPFNPLIDPSAFRSVVVATEVWKEAGWGTIIYLSALTRIDQEIYEAARIDGANRWQCMWYITLPGISSTIAVMLILRLGSILNNGFEQIFLLYSTYVYSVADVFETYTYRIGLMDARYSYSTAVGLFQSVVGCVMVFGTNAISRRISESSLF
ncbi:MAG TPA: sugar ABC transporter permease [Candidatus Ornithocaccomicrobium faecavium]|uniref:Sugar ABC transporter permease n=1 Tax=Candidatus Ornithocaccomicrobium faecavium TaxID=2840890 RepID=A0A9D1P9E4_9FIRM|nr:sugar ABC transporter permease [Candidatus Ornithocaccomicrobium faecavium]